MAQRAPKLKGLMEKARRTADQTNRAFLKAEQRLNELEDRDARRAVRGQR